ncbi:MAG: hypothetical protein HUK21_05575 [Fibrobacteraceae bacterium]|nr:hypothetical protein [Fibrobacteraceae bacterium]
MLAVFKNIRIGVFLSFVNLLIQGTAFLVQNGVAKNLGNSEYGFFGILQSDLLIFGALADFGMATLILAFFAKRATEGQLFRNILQLRFFASLVVMVAMVVFALVFRHNHAAFYGELILAPSLILQHAFFDWYFTCGAMWKKLLISKVLHTVSYATIMTLALVVWKIESIEIIALCMLVSALPAWAFGVTSAFNRNLFKITKRTFRFIGLMYKAGLPYALASLASFAYLPAGLYFVDYFASGEYLSAYNYSHKLIALASGFMVHFISSSLLSLHDGSDGKVHLKDQFAFTLFILVVCFPLYLFPELVLKILFFAAPWTSEMMEQSAFVLRVMSMSLVLQAIRMPYISLLLKEKKVWKYVALISSGGVVNLVLCYWGIRLWGVHLTAAFVLFGDVSLTLLLAVDAIMCKRYSRSIQ